MEMNVLCPSTVSARTEIKYTSAVANWSVGYKDAKPMMGCFMDALIGTSQITHDNVSMDRFHAMAVMSQVPEEIFPVEFSKQIYTGRDIISMILPEDINYKGKAFYYKKEWAKYPSLHYSPTEYDVVVERGVLKQGILDKTAVGQGSAGGIFHIIHNEYGAKRMLDVIYGFQQITTSFFYYSGFTVGLSDISLPQDILKKVNKKISTVVAESEILIQQMHEGKLLPPVGMTSRDYFQEQMKAKLESGDDLVELILNGIDSRTNGLYNLIFSGSKGKKDNILSILGNIGQQDIGGRRFIDQFSDGRSSIYFQRGDYSAEAGGYHITSYTQGIRQTSYIPATQEARNGLINIALSTSVSGEQSRKFIKSLESLYSNYHYNSVRNNKIIQPLYGESAIDPRKVEKIVFRGMMISGNEFKSTFKATTSMLASDYRNKKNQDILNEEYIQLTNDRNTYRNLEFMMESQNPGYLCKKSRYMPVNILKLVEKISHKYGFGDFKKKKLNPISVINKVTQLCVSIGYSLLNPITEHNKMIIPSHIEKSLMLFKILIRTELCVASLLRAGIWDEPLDEIINTIKLGYSNALITPGTAIGIIAAQSISEPLTQFVLDTKHRSGAKGKKTNVIVRIKELASAKPTDKMKYPSMTLFVKPIYQHDKQKVQEIANHIEMMSFGRFITSEYLFYDNYGEPVHPDFLGEKEKIKDFEKYNFGASKPSNITKWSILFRLNPEELVLKNMKMETIIHKIQDIFPDLYLVYSTQTSEELFIRCYIKGSWRKNPLFNIKAQDLDKIKVRQLLDILKNMVIRGIDKIMTTEIISTVKSYVKDDGSISTKKVYVIVTEGTNLSECLGNPYLDRYNCHTDSIKETEEIYGIDIARQKIFSEFKSVTEEAAYDSHYSLIADEMTSTGKITPLERTGLDQREPNSILLRVSFHGPIQVITKAALNNKMEKIRDPSSSILMGQVPRLGTNYTSIILDEEFIQNNKVTAKNIIDELI